MILGIAQRKKGEAVTWKKIPSDRTLSTIYIKTKCAVLIRPRNPPIGHDGTISVALFLGEMCGSVEVCTL